MRRAPDTSFEDRPKIPSAPVATDEMKRTLGCEWDFALLSAKLDGDALKELAKQGACEERDRGGSDEENEGDDEDAPPKTHGSTPRRTAKFTPLFSAGSDDDGDDDSDDGGEGRDGAGDDGSDDSGDEDDEDEDEDDVHEADSILARRVGKDSSGALIDEFLVRWKVCCSRIASI